MADYRVVEGTQVHLDGTTYDAGAVLPELDAETATRLLKAGWITETKKSRPPRSSK